MATRTWIGRAAFGLVLAVTCGPAWGAGLAKLVAPLDGRTARVAESSLGDLVADGARAAVNAELALVQANLLRPELIPIGELSQEAIEQALSYPDERVVLVELSGEKIRAALERSLSVLPQPSTAFLQVSGLAVTFRSANPAGGRVDSVKVGNEPLAPRKVYRVALPISLAKGALGYFRIFDSVPPKQTGPSLSAAVADYARAARQINITPGQRLRDLSQPAR